MVEIPVTSSEHSHVGSRTTKTSQKSGKKLFSGGGGGVWLWDCGVLRTLENYFEGVYN